MHSSSSRWMKSRRNQKELSRLTWHLQRPLGSSRSRLIHGILLRQALRTYLQGDRRYHSKKSFERLPALLMRISKGGLQIVLQGSVASSYRLIHQKDLDGQLKRRFVSCASCLDACSSTQQDHAFSRIKFRNHLSATHVRLLESTEMYYCVVTIKATNQL